MKYFTGLVFDSTSVHYFKIENFKKRFDYKYQFNPLVNLSLLPPFEIENLKIEKIKKITEELSEIVDDHFGKNLNELQIEFNGIEIESKHHSMLLLKTVFNSDLMYLKESMFDFLKSEGVQFKSTEVENQIMLPIARFQYKEEAHLAIDIAKMEFNSPFVLNPKSITLFERKNFYWIKSMDLIQNNQQLNNNFVNSLWAN